ncbi:hypothetical protein E2C01_016629 [Portunus trituberculatus]|uniref:Uncharacterized protein n=1 Tax=Portunus trituberculatus TaxID=210409 RepID=A0A5B7DPJ1_PORTR|nr:hypothetical protein [Portunus trituberculatus]
MTKDEYQETEMIVTADKTQVASSAVEEGETNQVASSEDAEVCADMDSSGSNSEIQSKQVGNSNVAAYIIVDPAPLANSGGSMELQEQSASNVSQSTGEQMNHLIAGAAAYKEEKRLCRAPGAVERVGHTQPVQVGIEAGMANSHSGDGCVQCSVGGVGPPVVSCVLSYESQLATVSHDTDVGGHPLKVDGVSQGGQVEDEMMNDKGEVVVGVWVSPLTRLLRVHVLDLRAVR